MASTRRRSTRDPDSTPTRRRRKRRRWPIGIVVVLLSGVLLWMAPVIVAHTALKQEILSAALADFEGSVTIGAASLGWLSPLAAHDIAAHDAGGEPLAEVKSLRSEKSLLALLTDGNHPGTFRVEQPSMQLALREGGSNWEDALAPYLDRQSGGGSIEDLKLEIVGGVIEVRNKTTNGNWRVDELNAEVELASGSPQVLQARLVGQVKADGAAPGTVSADLTWKMGQEPDESPGAGQVAVRLKSLPLEPLAAAMQRLDGDVQIQGTLTCEGLCQWSAGGTTKRVQVDRLAARDLSLRARKWLGDDELRTAYLNGSGRLESNGNRLQLDGIVLDTEFARLEGHGVIRADQMTSAKVGAAILGELQKEDVHITGEVDIPRLASMLPSTLRIRPTTQIKSGKVRLALTSKSQGDAGITALFEASDLVAVDAGREIAWDKPILLTANLRHSDDGPVIDKLVCESNFLNVTARGTLVQGEADISGDLTQLAAEAGRLIDLGDLKLAGQLAGNLRWQRAGQRQVAADGQITLSDFELTAADNMPWREKQLVIGLAARADAVDGRIARVDTATARLDSAGDQLQAELLRPIDQPTAQSAWPLRLRARGRLATWLPRLQPFFAPSGWTLAGAIDVDATANVATAGIDADSVKIRLDQFRAQGDDWAIDEPTIQVETKGSWNTSDRRLVANTMSMTSSTMAFRADRVVLQFPKGSANVSGVVSYRADLERLQRWLRDPHQPTNTHLAGSVVGLVQASHQADVTQVDWSADVKDLIYASRKPSQTAHHTMPVSRTNDWREIWREPTVKLSSRERYDHRNDLLAVETFTATTDTLKVSAKGKIEELTERRVADIGGQIDYDLANVTKKLHGVLGPHIQLAGREQGKFKIKGPLVWPEPSAERNPSAVSVTSRSDVASRSMVPSDVIASANLGWHSANVQGMRVGQGELKGTLSDGLIRFASLDVPVSDGRFKSTPWIDLNMTPASLRVAKGPLVENVRISPEMCRTWLKYIAPLLADATRAEGRFSISLDSANLPLADTQGSDVIGELTIHSAQIGPGPMAQEFLSTAQQVKVVIDGGSTGGNNLMTASWLVVPEQTIRFEVEEGRVQHHGLTVTVDDVSIQTSGSVGFDQSVDMVAKVPIRNEWVEGKRYLSALKGTVLNIPVRGSLSKPRLDRRALTDLGRNTVRDAAGRLLQDEVNRGLQRLFGPSP